MKVIYDAYGYKYNKIFFWIALFIMAATAFNMVQKYGIGQYPYVVCNAVMSQCENSFFMKCSEDWCFKKFLEPGTYGTPPPKDWLYNHFGLYCFLLFVTAFGINHVTHNWGKLPKFRLALKEEHLQTLKKAAEKYGDKLEGDDEDAD